jgi:phosphatidylserine/phosphatidylglycerophosphate/cardiolipin synthase-like enzyme
VTGGLTEVGSPDLEALVRVAKLCAPGAVSEGRLAVAGLGHVAAKAPWLMGMPATAVEAVARSVLAERARPDRTHLELVWTGPEDHRATARDTAVVVRHLFEGAQGDVLAAGYSWDHGKDILQPLHRAMKDRGVTATFFMDITGRAPTEARRDRFATDHIDRFFRDNWPFGDPKPAIYFDPRTTEVKAMASIHAKCIVVDERQSLITSANFTDRGHTRNIEAGVLIDDPQFARHLLAQWRGLIASGLVQRYGG